MRVAPWRNGASAPRKVLRISAGFKPQVCILCPPRFFPWPPRLRLFYSVLSVDAYTNDRAGNLSDLTADKTSCWLPPSNSIAFMTART